MDLKCRLNSPWGLVLLLIATSYCVSAHEVECPVGWIDYDNFCYLIRDQTPLNYDDAQRDCKGKGAALTSINSAAEQNFIFTDLVATAAVNIIWIGLNDITSEGNYVWLDGNTFGYNNWGVGQPDNFGNEDCVQLYNTGFWNDLGCTTTNGYICKMKRTHFWIESAQYVGKEGTSLTVAVHRDGLISNQDQITLTAADVSTVLGTDYTAPTVTLTFPSGESIATATYPLSSDNLIEDMECFTLTLALAGATATGTIAGIYGTEESPTTSKVFIVDCTAVFWIEEVEYIEKENTNVVVTVHRDGNVANSDQTTLTAADITAVYGTDYSSPSNTALETVNFAAGDTSATVTYMILKDTEVEDLETFSLNLALSGPTTFAAIITPSTSTVQINDCTATFWIEEALYIGKEGVNLVVTVHRDGNLRNTDQVALTATNGVAVYGTDYSSPSTTATETLNFAAGDTVTTVTYTISSDTVIEDIETFTLDLTLSGTTATDMFATLGSPSSSTVYIMDCTAVFWIEEAQYIAKENTNLVVTVHRLGNFAGSDEITLTATDGTALYDADYSSPSNTAAETVNFAAGDATATVTYTINSDTLIEDMETFILALTLSGTTATNMFASLDSPISSTVYIVDCTAVFWIEEAQYVAKENTNLMVTIHRQGNLANADTLTLTSSDGVAIFGTDYSSPSNTRIDAINFAAGDTTATIAYTINSDTLTEDIETFTIDLALSGTTATNMFATVYSPSSSTIFIIDCTAVFWIEEAQYTVKENDNLVVAIHRMGNLASTDQLALTASDDTALYGTDFSSPSNTAAEIIDFAVGDTTSTVTYTINSDTLVEDIEIFTLNLALRGTSATDMFARVASPSLSTVYIIDCTAVFWIEEVEYTSKENDNLIVTVHREGNLANADEAVLTVVIGTAVYGTDFTSPSNTVAETVNFAAGDTTATVTYMILTDTVIEDVETFVLDLALSGTTATNMFATVISPNPTTVSIIDCTAVFWIEEAFYVVKESDILVVAVHRDGNLGGTDVLTLTNSDVTAIYGNDYLSDSNTAAHTIIFAAGDTISTMIYAIDTDTIIEDIEIFTLDLALTGTTATNMFATLISPSSATVYIIDCTAVFWIEEVQYKGKENVDLVVTVHREGNLVNTDQATLTATDGTAVYGTDYSSDRVAEIVSFGVGDTTSTVTYEILADTEIEDLEMFTLDLTLRGATNTNMFATVTSPSSATVCITDCTAVFWIEEATYSSKEDSNLVVTIHREGNRANTDQLNLLAVDGTAIFGTDYASPFSASIEPVNFAVGESTVTLTYTMSKDTLVEDTETFTLHLALTGTTLTNMFATTISPSSSTVYINDCTALFWIEEVQYTVKENTNLVITIHRDGNLFNTDEITLTATDGTAVYGTDYIYSSPSSDTSNVTFATGDTLAMVEYTLNGDSFIEDIETFTLELTLSGTTETDMFATVTSPSNATVYILDCTAVFWIEAVQYIGKENTNVVVTVHRRGNLNGTDEITLTASDITAVYGTDYSSPSDREVETVIFAAGDPTVSVTYTLSADALIEDSETFTLSLGFSGTTATNLFATVESGVATVTITDCTAYFWIEEKQYNTFEQTTLPITFHRGGYLGRTDRIMVAYTDGRATNPNDYTPSGDTAVIFDVGDTISTKTIRINPDNILEHNEMFNIEISIPVDATMLSQVATLYSPSVSEVIIHDPTWYVFDSPDYTVLESAGVVPVKIIRKGDLRSPGHVSLWTPFELTATAQTDFLSVNEQVNFAAGQSTATVNVAIIPDDAFEGHEQFQVYLEDPDTAEAVGDLNKATVTIYDDDIPDACPTGFCENGGACSLQRDFTFSCTCEPGFTGNQCQEVDNGNEGLSTAGMIGVGLGVGLLSLAALLTCLCCCIRLRRNSNQASTPYVTPVSDPNPLFLTSLESNSRLSPAFPSLLNMPYVGGNWSYEYNT